MRGKSKIKEYAHATIYSTIRVNNQKGLIFNTGPYGEWGIP